jgi:Uma2 family endonuclease
MMRETATLPLNIDAPPAGAGDFYEVINGQVVEPPPMSAYETWIANDLNKAILFHFANVGEVGRTSIELLFRIREEPNLQRRPDLAFVSYDRWPRDRPVPRTTAWRVVPDLAVEVVSPNDLAVEVVDKLDDYFRAGVRRVWVLYPTQRYAHLYESPTRITILDITGELDGGDILPGFRLKLADLFNEST